MIEKLAIVFIFGIFILIFSKQILNIAVTKRIAFSMLILFILIISSIAVKGLKVELMPNIEYKSVTVFVDVKGGMPSVDIERLIIKPVEESLSRVSNIKNIISNAKSGRAVVTVQLASDTNMDAASLEVREYFMRVADKLPDSIEKPVIARFDESDRPVVIISFTSNIKSTEELRYFVETNLEHKLMRVEGVAKVDISGGRERKIIVNLDEKNLVKYNISINEVIAAISDNNLNILVGKMEDDRFSYGLRSEGAFVSLEQIKNLGVKAADDFNIIRLKDIGDIEDSYLEAETYSRLNSKEAVTVYIQKENSANTIKVSNRISEVLDNFSAALEKDINMVTISNQGQRILKSISAIKTTIFYGIILVILVLGLVFSHHFFSRVFSLFVFALYFLCIFSVYFFNLDKALVEKFIIFNIAFFAVLAFFYKDYRPSLIIAITIPISLLLTITLMYLGDVSINIMSLSGLLLGVGLLVDNSIVVVETYISIHRQKPAQSNIETIKEASHLMLKPIVGSTITTVVVFLSFFFLDKKMQVMYQDIAFTTTAALFASLFCAIGVVPMLLTFYEKKIFRIDFRSKFLEDLTFKFKSKFDQIFLYLKEKIKARASLIIKSCVFLIFIIFFLITYFANYPIDKLLFLFLVTVFFLLSVFGVLFYKDFVRKLLHKRRKFIVIIFCFLIFGFSFFEFSRRIPKDFITSEESEQFTVFVELASGVKLDIANHTAKNVERIIRQTKELKGSIKTVSSKIEGWSAKVFVTLVESEKRDISTSEAIDILREKLKDIGKDYDGFVYFSEPYEGKEIFLDIYGYDYTVLLNLANKLSNGMNNTGVFHEVKVRYKPGRPDILVKLIQKIVCRLGFDIDTVAKTLHAKMRGLKASDFKTKNERIETVVRVMPKNREDVKSLKNLSIKGRDKTGFFTFPVDHIASLGFGLSPSEIWHKNKERMIQVSAGIGNSSLEQAGILAREVIEQIEFPENYYADIGGEYKDMLRSQKSFKKAIVLTVFFVFAVMASIFESLLIPFIIMFTVLLSSIGAVYSLIISNSIISAGVLVGMLMIGGIIVNNGIILISCINRNLGLRKNKSFKNVLIDSSYSRLKPVFITLVTTVCGLLPLVLDKSSSSALWKPFAITVIGGLIIGTFFTLIVVPLVFSVFYFVFGKSRL
ncbi:efflux RND transporter permease subunit [bacterium]